MHSKIYVSGSSLAWEYDTGSIVAKYTAVGALPDPALGAFSSLPVGRVWVATDDTFLYYKDEAGTTRFLRGMPKQTSAPEDTGSLRVLTHECPDYSSSILLSNTLITPGQNLSWNSKGNKYFYRGEEALTPRTKALIPHMNFDIEAPVLVAGNVYTRTFRYEFAIGGWTTELDGVQIVGITASAAGTTPFFNIYTDSNCTTATGSILSNIEFAGNENLILPANPQQLAGTVWWVSGSKFTVDIADGSYYRIETSSANVKIRVNGKFSDIDVAYQDTFCTGIDKMTSLTLIGGQCKQILPGGSYSPPDPPPPIDYCDNYPCDSILPQENAPECGGSCPHCAGIEGGSICVSSL